MNIKNIIRELKAHSPLTAFGALMGVLVLLLMLHFSSSLSHSQSLFETAHPIHILLSAFATAATFRRAGGSGFWKTILIGYFGSIGICTISDCVIPYFGEWILKFPNREFDFCFIEHWAIINPLALVGIWMGVLMSKTRISHALHVFISTLASLFHITMAMVVTPSISYILAIGFFLFLSVLIPCCTSDIIFPLFFVKNKENCNKHSCLCGHN